MNFTACRETQCHQAVQKLITALHSKCYQPSGMLIHWKNLYAPHSQWSPVAMKHRAMNRTTKLKKLSMQYLSLTDNMF
jgi:hypothetical protein